MGRPEVKQSKDAGKNLAQLSFGFSLTMAFLAILAVWIITPLSYAFVLYVIITSRSNFNFNFKSSYTAINYVLLVYCSIEMLFSFYYCYLSIKVNKLRTGPVRTRKFLRSLFSKSLENGLTVEAKEECIDEALAAVGLGSEKSETEKSSFEIRRRKRESNGHLNEKIHNLEEQLSPDDPRALDFQSHIRLWFHDIEFKEIYKGNMLEWISWSLYGATYEQLVKDRKAWIENGKPEVFIDGIVDGDDDGLEIEGDKLSLVEHCVELMEARAGQVFPPGRNDKIKVIRLTLDKVKVHSRPFILYAFVWAAQKLVITNSKRYGFIESITGSCRYLIRVPKGWQPPNNGAELPELEKPLLFIHGLGMGMAQYATLLSHFNTAPELQNRPVIVLLQPWISMSFFSSDYLNPPSQKSYTGELLQIFKQYRLDEAGITVLSHSNGTMVHSWLLKEAPELFTRNCFVDPVTFCLWEPFVAFGFLYSSPSTPIEFLMRYYVGRELGIAYMLQRHFDWCSNLLLAETIPNLRSPFHTAVYMSGLDSILNATRIRRYLRVAGMKEVGKGENVGEERGGLKTHHTHKHGESMIGSGRAFMQIMSWVDGDLGGNQVGDSDSH